MLKINRLNAIYLIVAFFIFSSFKPTEINKNERSSKGNTLTVIIKNIRNKSGRIQLDLYKNQEEYAARKSNEKRRAYVYKKAVSDGKITYKYYNVPDGVYGIALFDDENQNGEIDFGWFLPNEGFGFGDYYHKKWSEPHFNDFKFSLNEDKTVVMVVRYL